MIQKKSLLPLVLMSMAMVASAQYADKYFPLGLGPDCEVVNPSKDKAVPANEPYKFAWELFVKVNANSDIQWEVTLPDGSKVITNNAVWETWVSDDYNFPKNPNPKDPPTWEGRIDYLKKMDRPATQKALLLSAHKTDQDTSSEAIEVVFRNKATFEYIIEHDLWYTQGLAAYFKSGNKIVFPVKSIEVKGNWIPIKESEKTKYHWNYIPDEKGVVRLMGLVASHISSKDLPNWFWATFEHVENAGRCDYIGCRDCFGQKPAFTPSHTDAVGGQYPPEKQTKALVDMFKAAGYSGNYFKEYSNYRLKGVMISYTDSTGVPNFLGNSVTESGFVQTSSCMTCHSRAAIGPDGKSAFPVAGERQGWPLTDQTPVQYNVNSIMYFGNPDPNWYYTFTGNGTKTQYLQTDFVWAIPFKTNPADPKYLEE